MSVLTYESVFCFPSKSCHHKFVPRTHTGSAQESWNVGIPPVGIPEANAAALVPLPTNRTYTNKVKNTN